MLSPFSEFLDYVNRLVEGYIRKEPVIIDDVLLIAPNGTGKTYVVNNLANILEKSIIKVSYCKLNIISHNRESLMNDGLIENMLNESEIRKELFYVAVIEAEILFKEYRECVFDELLNVFNSYRENGNSNILMVADRKSVV